LFGELMALRATGELYGRNSVPLSVSTVVVSNAVPDFEQENSMDRPRSPSSSSPTTFRVAGPTWLVHFGKRMRARSKLSFRFELEPSPTQVSYV
jgi:hypothetical protein